MTLGAGSLLVIYSSMKVAFFWHSYSDFSPPRSEPDFSCTRGCSRRARGRRGGRDIRQTWALTSDYARAPVFSVIDTAVVAPGARLPARRPAAGQRAGAGRARAARVRLALLNYCPSCGCQPAPSKRKDNKRCSPALPSAPHSACAPSPPRVSLRSVRSRHRPPCGRRLARASGNYGSSS